MAVPTHFKFTIRGSFRETPETWVTHCKMSRDNPAGADANYGDIDESAVTAAITAWLNRSIPAGASLVSNAVQVDDWRCYQIGTDGTMETPTGPLIVAFEPDELVGGGSRRYPPQISVVATLVAPENGPAKFGRMYLPGPAVALETDSRLSVAAATAYAVSTSALLKDISNAIDLEGVLSSEGLNVSHGPPASTTGTKQVIDHVEVGRVLDTLRNRRKSMEEERYADAHIDW